MSHWILAFVAVVVIDSADQNPRADDHQPRRESMDRLDALAALIAFVLAYGGRSRS